ncbi:MAG TPA: response regulator [Thermoanaerobaculia bacterium]|nr:response regulator [Thermoanaerobaculia bacterium]
MSRSVLVIDDDAGVRALLATLLGRRGVGVELARNGEVGLAKLQERDYDAILLDLMMPDLDGFEVVQRLRSSAPELLQKVIVMTAVAERTLGQLDAASVRKVFRKPFDISELMDEVCGVWSTAETSRAPLS